MNKSICTDHSINWKHIPFGWAVSAVVVMPTMLADIADGTSSETGYTTVSTVSNATINNLFQGLKSVNISNTNGTYNYFSSSIRDNTTSMTNKPNNYFNSWDRNSPQFYNLSYEVYDPVDALRNWTYENDSWSTWITDIRIPFYIVILVLAVVGNTLVIVTLAQNKRMRTVTNVFLLNLSISDLLLAIFCMPFTLIPSVMRNFIFGETVCILIRYLQGESLLLI